MESNNAAAPEARDVALPIFYRRPRPVDRERDRGWSLQPTPDVRYARATNSVLLGAAEFARAMHSYPIVFTSTEPRVAVAVLGLDGDQNLFVGEDGKWREGNYIPAYVRRYPFVYANDDVNKQMVLCIDRAAEFIVDGGDMPFFENGQPSEYTKACMEFCNNFEMERQRTMSFVQLLKDLDLFELKTATFTPPTQEGQPPAEPQKIAEYFGVSEEKLNKLPTDKYIELRDNGALAQIYAHLLSLVGWDRLVALAIAKQTAPPQAANQ